MSMSADSLKSKIENNLKASGFKIIDLNKKFIEAIAKAVVEEIQSNAEVTGSSSDGASVKGKVQ